VTGDSSRNPETIGLPTPGCETRHIPTGVHPDFRLGLVVGTNQPSRPWPGWTMPSETTLSGSSRARRPKPTRAAILH